MRVLFGSGRLAHLPDEVDRLGLRRVLVLCTPGRRELGQRAAELLGDAAIGVFDGARMHVPVDVAEAGVAEARRLDADGCVAIGGGSTIGLAKAIARDTGLPSVCVPTTYSGSEMTPVWGLTEDGDKRTGRDPVVLPRSVVYDPELTVGLAAHTSAASGVNALAHAVEALYAPDVSPVIALLAEEAARSLASALPAVVRAPADVTGRALALRGAWLAGACLGATTMSLHHKLCHVLGGLLDLPHAETHTVVLPHVAAFNLEAAPRAAAALRRALGADDPARALYELNRMLELPSSLAELGVARADLSAAADAVLARPYINPRQADRDAVLGLLQNAWAGTVPNAAAEPLPAVAAISTRSI
ncbi:maleylacetate reductase [Pseudonocardia sp. NPDC049154]|uniref:maleylacetate reductase n=1 Tax=Pseudonocardia sp. NPDC049154 TaxID=3155501 RepID=UPI0034041BB5